MFVRGLGYTGLQQGFLFDGQRAAPGHDLPGHGFPEHPRQNRNIRPVGLHRPERTALEQERKPEVIQGCVQVITQITAKFAEDSRNNTGATATNASDSDGR